VFKRISHLAGTKRFYFRNPRPFFNLLRIFLAAVALLDSILLLLRAHTASPFHFTPCPRAPPGKRGTSAHTGPTLPVL
jgi:hypothetical protein